MLKDKRTELFVKGCSCYLGMLDKIQKRICKTNGLTLADALESLGRCTNVVSLNLFYMYYFDRYWLYWFHLLILIGNLLVILTA